MKENNSKSQNNAPNRVLIVEDEELNQKILKGDLTKSGYDSVCADNGRIALDILKQDKEFDVILLDRMMPEMNGMETLLQLQKDPALKDIPVVMQTAEASPEQIKEGIESGVFYYLTKPFSKTTLLAIVQSAIDDSQNKKQLVSKATETGLSLGLMDKSVFRFRTLEEAKSLSSFLAHACPIPQKVVYGLYELMANAIEHGNLGFSYDDKKDLINSSQWKEELSKRLNDSANANIYATVTFARKENGVEFTIFDQGDGFDWNNYTRASLSRATDPNGRGISIARVLCFDELEYIAPGNAVRAFAKK